ncbi:MAG: hypothetical protein ACO1RT_10165 [Planctomycetaceae bacterium]
MTITSWPCEDPLVANEIEIKWRLIDTVTGEVRKVFTGHAEECCFPGDYVTFSGFRHVGFSDDGKDLVCVRSQGVVSADLFSIALSDFR